jgi:hypothetical protein
VLTLPWGYSILDEISQFPMHKNEVQGKLLQGGYEMVRKGMGMGNFIF